MLYFTIWCNSNAFSLLKCKIHQERGIAGSWNSGPKISTEEKAILRSSKWSMDFWRIILEYMKNYGAKMCQRGATACPHGQVARPSPGHAMCPCGAVATRLPTSFGNKIPFDLEKIIEKFWDFPPPSRGGTRAGALSLCGRAIPPRILPSGRGNRSLHHHQLSSHRGYHHLPSTSSPAPSHL